MKRLLAFACALVILISCCFFVGAQSTAQFSLVVSEVKNNRLFDIDLCSLYDASISGGQFELTYDNAIVEYRSVSSEYFEVEAKDYGNKLHIVFATADGVISAESVDIINIRFKSIAQGEFDAQLEIIECIDNNLQDVLVTPSGATIKVDKSSVTATTKTKSQSELTSKKSAGTSEMSQIEESSSYDMISTIDSNYVNKAVLCGVCAGILVIVAFALGVLFKKKADDKEDNSDNEKDRS